MDATTVLEHFGNLATRQQLLEAGLSGGDLTAAVRLGRSWRVRRGYYAAPSVSPEALAAVRVGGRLAGPSAARSYGFWAGFDTRLHVAVPFNAGRLRTNFAPSLGRDLTPDTSARDIVLHWTHKSTNRECWRVSATEAVHQMVTWSDRETAVASIDTARTLLPLSQAQIAGLFRLDPAAIRLAASKSRPGSDAGGESVVRQRLLLVGVHVDQQVAIRGVGEVDMIVRGTRVVIEVDGRAFHSARAQFENDRRRGSELAARGYDRIQLTYQQIFENWPWCIEVIFRAISRNSGVAVTHGADGNWGDHFVALDPHPSHQLLN
jgi:very-short-patch-repair endonuclease